MSYESRGLLCPPDGFRIDDDKIINAWMDPLVQPASDLAMAQWRNIFCQFVKYGMRVFIAGADPVYQDQCFAANVAHFYKGKIVLANFLGKPGRVRQGEIPLYKKWLENHKKKFDFEIITWPESKVAFEGQGDVVTVGEGENSLVLVGYGQSRSDFGAAGVLASIYNFPRERVIPMKLINKKFYHLDTACAYIPINSLYITDGSGFLLREKLRFRGIRVVRVDTSEFRKSGGSVRCLTFLFPKDEEFDHSARSHGVFIYYPEAFDAASLYIIRNVIPKELPVSLIEVSEKEANNFVCNGVFIR